MATWQVTFDIPPLKDNKFCHYNCPLFDVQLEPGFVSYYKDSRDWCHCKMGWAEGSYTYEAKPDKFGCPRYKDLKKEK